MAVLPAQLCNVPGAQCWLFWKVGYTEVALARSASWRDHIVKTVHNFHNSQHWFWGKWLIDSKAGRFDHLMMENFFLSQSILMRRSSSPPPLFRAHISLHILSYSSSFIAIYFPILFLVRTLKSKHLAMNQCTSITQAITSGSWDSSFEILSISNIFLPHLLVPVGPIRPIKVSITSI